MISLAAATGLAEAIDAAGVDCDKILRPFGLDRRTLGNEDGFMPAGDFARILEDAARVTGDRHFGLHFGERFHPKDLGALAYVVLNSATIAAGVASAARYYRVHNEAVKWTLDVAGAMASLRYELADFGLEMPSQNHECAFAVALNMTRLMVGSQWVPVEVQFIHTAPGDTSEHLRVFGAPVSFSCARNAFVVPREFLARHVPAADERLHAILTRYLDRVLEDMPREDGVLPAARRAVAELMRDGEPTLAPVARKVAMSARTLQRRLKERGVHFHELVDDTRRRFALNYLRNPDNALSEVAYLLGYSEVSAFNRAFRRWTGATPSSFRGGGVTG
jgi:AraC-like DNA-binding protein